MFDGDYQFGCQMVIKCLGGVCLVDGMFVGSMLMMDQVLCNLVLELGLLLVDVLCCVLIYVVDYLGFGDCGWLVGGVWVDFVVVDLCLLMLQCVVIEGEEVDFEDV